jgi:hypothetical protein
MTIDAQHVSPDGQGWVLLHCDAPVHWPASAEPEPLLLVEPPAPLELLEPLLPPELLAPLEPLPVPPELLVPLELLLGPPELLAPLELPLLLLAPELLIPPELLPLLPEPPAPLEPPPLSEEVPPSSTEPGDSTNALPPQATTRLAATVTLARRRPIESVYAHLARHARRRTGAPGWYPGRDASQAIIAHE